MNKPLLDLEFLSHGTVECADLERARKFYTEVFGMEVVQTSAISFFMRLNSETVVACVQHKGGTSGGVFNHFGFDVLTREEVDEAYEKIEAISDEYGLRKVSKPVDQHGTYSFYIIDYDDNWWEILVNPNGGYSYVFEMDEEKRDWNDQDQGKDRIERSEQN